MCFVCLQHGAQAACFARMQLDLPDLWPCLRADAGQFEDDDGWYTGLYTDLGFPKVWSSGHRLRER